MMPDVNQCSGVHERNKSPELPGAGRYPRLFSSIRLGRLTLPNRWVVPGLTTNFAEDDGSVGDRLTTYLRARASGGFGLIVTENIGVHASGRVMPRMLMGSEDRFVPGLARLASAVKQEGGVLFGQISHAGRQTKSRITGMPLVAPSALPCPLNREVPQTLSVERVHEMEQAFVDAARRLATAGFDGIEIHGAHGYLVGGFLSRYSNERTDDYGGPLENRMRFLVRIVEGIKRELGDDFPISVRISAREFVPEGLDLAESTQIGQRLRESGIHALSVSVGVYESFHQLSMITGEPEGQWLHLAGALREHVAPLPIIGVGRIKRPGVAERALRDGMIDLAAFGRASIADPALPRKILNGRQESVVPCFGCNVCLGRSSRPDTICPVNPTVGRERNFQDREAKTTTYIRVVGSSLSALTAACLAARRGHHVSMDLVGEPVGGMQAWRAAIPGQGEYAEVILAAQRRAFAAGVTFSEAPPSDDVAIWRVRRYQPVTLCRIHGHATVITPYDILSGARLFLEGTTAAAVGSDLATAESAIRLADAGCLVRLYSPAKNVAIDAHPGYRRTCRGLLGTLGVELHLESSGPDEAVLEWADVLVAGCRPGVVDYDDPKFWYMAPAVGSAYGSARTDAAISDAYEPDAMTKGVYEATELALHIGD